MFFFCFQLKKKKNEQQKEYLNEWSLNVKLLHRVALEPSFAYI